MKFKDSLSKIRQSKLASNSIWGSGAMAIQTILSSIFFLLVARTYEPIEFGSFLIATTIYQVVVAFSSLGLAPWFIREFLKRKDKEAFSNHFLITQTKLGLLFSIFNILLIFVIYDDHKIRILGTILSCNIIFDNVTYVIRNMNIALAQQKKTAFLLISDGFLKLLIGVGILVIPVSIIYLCIFFVIAKILTITAFVLMDTSGFYKLQNIVKQKSSWNEVKLLLFRNWKFIIIGSISIIFWRVSHIIISKFLSLEDVSNYEIAFRIFSIFLIVPTIGAATVYPRFVKLNLDGEFYKIKSLYKDCVIFLTIFSIISYGFIQTFGETILLNTFGSSYYGAVLCMREMFVSILIFPILLIQANLIVALGKEKLDMIFNILSLLANVVISITVVKITFSLSGINYSVFASLIIFYVLQGITLKKLGVTSSKSLILSYCITASVPLMYIFLSKFLNHYYIFGISTIIALGYALVTVSLKQEATNTDYQKAAAINNI